MFFVCVCLKGGLEAIRGEVKKAFLRMAAKFHTEVRDMGEDYQKQARERFDRITAAYEAIKQQRGIK